MTYYGAGFCHVVFEDKDGKGLPALSAVALDGTEVHHGLSSHRVAMHIAAMHMVTMHMMIMRRVAMA